MISISNIEITIVIVISIDVNIRIIIGLSINYQCQYLRSIEITISATMITDISISTPNTSTVILCRGVASWVRVGDLNLKRTDDDAKPQDIRIIERIKHPMYKPPSEYHDIALLKLEIDVQFDAWIRPSCLPYSLPDTGNDDKATATGWGLVDWSKCND